MYTNHQRVNGFLGNKICYAMAMCNYEEPPCPLLRGLADLSLRIDLENIRDAVAWTLQSSE
jgi:hypothetical protein